MLNQNMDLEYAYLLDVQRAIRGSFEGLVTDVRLASDRFEQYPQLRVNVDDRCEYPDATQFMLHEFATQHGLALAPTAANEHADYELAIHPAAIDVPTNHRRIGP
jgi:hypothetical protein